MLNVLHPFLILENLKTYTSGIFEEGGVKMIDIPLRYRGGGQVPPTIRYATGYTILYL